MDLQAGLGRRDVLALAGAYALPVPAGKALSFAILRNGARIGTQRVEFEQAGGALTIRSHAELRVLVLSIPVFHYAIEVVERWSAAGFQQAASRVNDDGTRRAVAVRREAGHVAIERSGAPASRAPAGALPFTHWNQAALRGPLIDMATGAVQRPQVAALGWYRLPVLPEGSVTARRYRITGALTLSDYYDRQLIWAGQEYSHRGRIVYEKIL